MSCHEKLTNKGELVPPFDPNLLRGKDTRTDEQLISDDRIREILAQFGTILHLGMTRSKEFQMVHHGYGKSDKVPMLEDETGLWEKYFKMRPHIATGVKEGTLYVPEVTIDEGGSVTPTIPLTDENTFRINFSGKYMDDIPVPVSPLDSHNISYFITPTAEMTGGHIGDLDGMPITTTTDGLESASLGIEVTAQDSRGRWIYSNQPGLPKRMLIPDPLARTVIRFNTYIEVGGPNHLRRDSLSCVDNSWHGWCTINDLKTLDRLPIPDDPGLRLFFWQIDRFMPKEPLNPSPYFSLISRTWN